MNIEPCNSSPQKPLKTASSLEGVGLRVKRVCLLVRGCVVIRHPGQAPWNGALALLNLAFGECVKRNSTGRAGIQDVIISLVLVDSGSRGALHRSSGMTVCCVAKRPSRSGGSFQVVEECV